MRIKLVNSNQTIVIVEQIFSYPPKDGWRLVERRKSSGGRAILRNVKKNGKWTTENLKNYLYPEDVNEYKKNLLKLKIKPIRRKRTDRDKYIVSAKNGSFYVVIDNVYYGTFGTKSQARVIRDKVMRGTSQHTRR
jgi:hypothetical protein